MRDLARVGEGEVEGETSVVGAYELGSGLGLHNWYYYSRHEKRHEKEQEYSTSILLWHLILCRPT